MEKRIEGSYIADEVIVKQKDVSLPALRGGKLVESTAHDDCDIACLKNIFFRSCLDGVIVLCGSDYLSSCMPVKRIILGKVVVEKSYALDLRILYCFSSVFKNREHIKPLSKWIG